MIEIPAQGCAYFASDLHLSTGTPKTLEAFESWISQIAQPGNMIFLLGDVFEVWVGDDHEDEVTQRVAKATRNAGNCGAAVYFMHGNRDFVMGDDYPALAGFEVLADPEFLLADGKPILITHGDQLCTDDKPYQKFRLESRTHHWMEHFLGKSLDERLKLAQHMRLQSQMHKSVHNPDIMDVNEKAAQAALQGKWPDGSLKGRSSVIIHGHTHRCAIHLPQDGVTQTQSQSGKLQEGLRIVLPDWNYDDPGHSAQKGGFLKIESNGKFTLTVVH